MSAQNKTFLQFSPHLELQSASDVVEEDFAEVTAVREMVREVDLASERNVATELVPPGETDTDGLA